MAPTVFVLELDGIAIVEVPEALSVDGGEVHPDVMRELGRDDGSPTLLGAEELHSTGQPLASRCIAHARSLPARARAMCRYIEPSDRASCERDVPYPGRSRDRVHQVVPAEAG